MTDTRPVTASPTAPVGLVGHRRAADAALILALSVWLLLAWRRRQVAAATDG